MMLRRSAVNVLGRALGVAIALPILVTTACSDSPPATARGSVIVDVTPSSVAEYASLCNFGPHQALIGGDADKLLPNAFDPGTRVVDGDDGTTVSCRVAGSSSFEFRGRIRKGNVEVSVDGRVPSADSGTAPGAGNVYVSTPNTSRQALEPLDASTVDSCSFTPVEVAPGRAWSAFDCPVLKASDQTNTYCGARGYFVFENCDR